MKIERMEYLGIVVDDLEAGVRRFEDVFGLDFEILDMKDMEIQVQEGVMADPQAPTSGMRVALDSSGLVELVETAGADEGFRNIHFRVDDMDDAIDVLSGKGLRLLRQFVVGDMREAIFAPGDLYGIRVCLLQYDGTSLAAAMRRPSTMSMGREA